MDYSYLICSAAYVALILMLGRFTLPCEQFRLIHFAGLINAPGGLFIYFLEDNYWNPPRLGGLRIGFEDLLISYAVAAVAWYTVAILWKQRLQTHHNLSEVAKRCLQIPACGLTYLVAVCIGVDPMTSMIVTYGLAAAVMWWLRPGNWPLAATGVVTFPVVWFSVCALTFWLLPESIFRWNLESVWGHLVWGVPVGEIVWAFVFGAFFPLLTGIVFNVQIGSKKI